MAEQIQNINLNINTRKKFSIDGNPNKIIELDVTDISIIDRYKESVEKMRGLAENYERMGTIANELKTATDGDEIDTDTTYGKISEFTGEMKKLERKMRDIIDFIFDSPISDTILENTSAFSPVNGKCYKYEQILEVLSNLYTKSISSDIQKINKSNVRKHTAKYIKR